MINFLKDYHAMITITLVYIAAFTLIIVFMPGCRSQEQMDEETKYYKNGYLPEIKTTKQMVLNYEPTYSKPSVFTFEYDGHRFICLRAWDETVLKHHPSCPCLLNK